MRVRIVFRGLVLFRFENPQSPNDMGSMTVQMINKPGSIEFHDHTPKIAVIGRDRTLGHEVITNPIPFGGKRITLALSDATGGVAPDDTFNDYVPRLKTVYGSPTPELAPDENYVAAEISISGFNTTHNKKTRKGHLAARELVTWNVGGRTLGEVEFMNSKQNGPVADEVVLEIGDDHDLTEYDPDSVLEIGGAPTPIPLKMWPLTKKGGAYRDEVDPNTVEILVTNFAPQRLHSVPWSMHYQWLFDAAGYPRRAFDLYPPQFEQFASAAGTYQQAEFDDDLGATVTSGAGQPFPYIKAGGPTRPPKKNPGKPGDANLPPHPPGRRSSTLGKLKDPLIRPICLGGWD